ncbi:MAG TPA: zinc-binding dehydrogenase [Oculatellaceae cyanobacterium]
MKAVSYSQFGAPSVLQYQDVDTPTITETQVLVKVAAAGVNFADILQRKNVYPIPQKLPRIPGFEVAGTIESVGNKVTGLKVGDRVGALTMDGGYSEFAAAEAINVFPIPKGVSFEVAAALPGQALTVYFMLEEAGLAKGQTLAIDAAAGGVGAVTAQIAKLKGVGKVIGITGSAEKLANLKKNGYDNGVSTDKGNWKEELLHLTDGKGVDVFLDSVGGELFFGALETLAVGGTVVAFGRASGQETNFDPRVLMMKNQSVRGFSLWNYMSQPNRMKEALKSLLADVETGRLKIDASTYPLKDAAKVHELMETRATTGKLILQP